MDDPALDPAAHRDALDGLARLNRCAGSAGALWHELGPVLRTRQRDSPLRVLDIACGGGDVTVALARRARLAGYRVRITGCDRSETALDVARRRADRARLEASWVRCDVAREPLPTGFDVVVCTLFLHHLDRSDAVIALRGMARAADRIRLVDLLRSRPGWHLARLGTRLLSRSAVVRLDGPRSVEGAFTHAEVQRLADAAGLRGAESRPCWPARFMLRWDRADADDSL